MLIRCLLVVLAVSIGSVVSAGPAPFDLAGPVLEVKVTRGSDTLPASEVPNLAPGDRVWIKVDLPESQSVQYLMVAAFLSGSTNPPPEKWFFACKIWSAKCGSDGLTVPVPQGHQRGFAHADGCRARPARRIRAHFAGFESGRARPLPPRAISRRGSRSQRWR